MKYTDLCARLLGWAKDIQTGSTAVWAMDQDLKQAATAIQHLLKANNELEAKVRESAMQELASLGQAQEAYEAQLAAEAKVAQLEGALQAVEKLAITASIASCTCHVKTPEITFHSANCRYVLLQYITAQCEDARTAIRKGATP